MKPPADLIDVQSIVDQSQTIRQHAAQVLRQAEELKTKLERSRLEMLRTMQHSFGLFSNGAAQSRHRRNQQP